MYACYRVKMEEHIEGHGWVDDGSIYCIQPEPLGIEIERRRFNSFAEGENVRAGKLEIVTIHESLFNDLKRTPVLSSMKGEHPGDWGLLFRPGQSLCIQAGAKRQDSTSGLSMAH